MDNLERLQLSLEFKLEAEIRYKQGDFRNWQHWHDFQRGEMAVRHCLGDMGYIGGDQCPCSICQDIINTGTLIFTTEEEVI